jgi:hypothetical protein
VKTTNEAIIDRTFRVIVLDVPTVATAEALAGGGPLCDRLAELLGLEARVVVVDSGRAGLADRGICGNIRPMAKVFLYVLTPEGDLFGFDQWGRPVCLSGRCRMPAAPPLPASEGARLILDAVAELADIPPTDVLYIGEDFSPKSIASGFLAPEAGDVRIVAMTDRGPTPPGVRRAKADLETLVGLLDGVLWRLR